MPFGVPRLKKIVILAVCILACALLVSCGGSSSTTKPPSNLTFRAFVSNPLHPTTGGIMPALDIVDATNDLLSTAGVSLSGLMPNAGLMVVSPKKDFTLVVSQTGNQIAIVSNAKESGLGSTTLSGTTESVVVGSDDTTAFVAIPQAPVFGQSPGAVDRLNLSQTALTAVIPVPGARYLVLSPSGNQTLVFSDNSNSVTLLFPALLGSTLQTNSQTPCSGAAVAACAVSGFDRPVWGVFDSSGSTAYIFSCGLECGGTSNASITPLNMSSLTPGTPIQLVSGGLIGGATTGLLSGSTLYVAGTSPTPCPGTATLDCGVLSVVDVGSATVTSAQLIPDGYHNRIQMGANGQLFVGSHGCSTVTSGCLAIFDTMHSKVTIPPQNGDVTGIEPIPNRNVVYVCQGGGLQIYDTTTDQLQTTQVNIVGQAIDVKVVDF
jgi:hypothetical protein